MSGGVGAAHRGSFQGFEVVAFEDDQGVRFSVLRGRMKYEHDLRAEAEPTLDLEGALSWLDKLRPRTWIAIHYYDRPLSDALSSSVRETLGSACQAKRLRCVFAI